jgi:hypothetical protein
MTFVDVKTSLVEISAALIRNAMKNSTAAAMASTGHPPFVVSYEVFPRPSAPDPRRQAPDGGTWFASLIASGRVGSVRLGTSKRWGRKGKDYSPADAGPGRRDGKRAA